MRALIHPSGKIEHLPDRKHTISEIRKLIGADTLDTVLLADGKHVMLLDDASHAKGLPVNAEGTRRYHEKCIPGSNPPPILGAIVIVPDSDFA